MNRKIVIPGGKGFIGRHLVRHFRNSGDRVIVFTRQTPTHPDEVQWDGRSLGDWQSELEGADILINLSGKSVNCRYTHQNRAAIYGSRLESTKILAVALANAVRGPSIWLNASTATLYRDARDREMDELTGEIGSGFSVNVAQQWEKTFFSPDLSDIRRVALRSAIVFGRGSGGPFEIFRRLTKLGLGGTQGDGGQYVSWIHIRDFCRAVDWILAHPELAGPLNLASPHPLPNQEFMADFRRQMGIPVGLPAPAWLLEIGTFLLRTECELVLKSRRVTSKRLMDSGFQFHYEFWPEALAELLERNSPREPAFQLAKSKAS